MAPTNKYLLMLLGVAAIIAGLTLDLGQATSSILMGMGIGTFLVVLFKGGGC